MSFAAIQLSQAEQDAPPPKDKRSLVEIQEEERARQVEEDFLRWWTAEEERLRQERERDREASGRVRRQEREREAGRRYQARWGELLSSEGRTLGFRDIPWPVFSQPRALDGLVAEKVAMFVLSPLHPGETRREKVRNALRR